VETLPLAYQPENADNQSLKGCVLNNWTLEMYKILAHMNVSIVFKFFFLKFSL
jgi:ATP/ADP translocase